MIKQHADKLLSPLGEVSFTLINSNTMEALVILPTQIPRDVTNTRSASHLPCVKAAKAQVKELLGEDFKLMTSTLNFSQKYPRAAVVVRFRLH